MVGGDGTVVVVVGAVVAVVVEEGTVVAGGRAATLGAVDTIVVEPFGTVVDVGATVVEETGTGVVEVTTRGGAVVELVGTDGGGGARNATAGAAATAALTCTSLTGRVPPSGPPNTRPSVHRTARPTSPTHPRRASRARFRDRSTSAHRRIPAPVEPPTLRTGASGAPIWRHAHAGSSYSGVTVSAARQHHQATSDR